MAVAAAVDISGAGQGPAAGCWTCAAAWEWVRQVDSKAVPLRTGGTQAEAVDAATEAAVEAATEVAVETTEAATEAAKTGDGAPSPACVCGRPAYSAT